MHYPLGHSIRSMYSFPLLMHQYLPLLQTIQNSFPSFAMQLVLLMALTSTAVLLLLIDMLPTTGRVF